MKAKKLMFGIMGAVAMITSANAITEEQCKKSSKMYWVAANGECVPVNTCDSDRYAKDYCNKDFAGVQTGSVRQAVELSRSYLELKGVGSIDCATSQTAQERSAFGQNYIACTFYTSKGTSYKVFEFDDTTHGKGESSLEYDEAAAVLCTALGGQVFDSIYCKGITESECDDLREMLDGLYIGDSRINWDGSSVDFSDAYGCPMNDKKLKNE